MNPPLIPDEWRTNWHLAGHVDKLEERGTFDVTVADVSLQITSDASGPSARGAGRRYPVMVVDDEIFVLLNDGPE